MLPDFFQKTNCGLAPCFGTLFIIRWSTGTGLAEVQLVWMSRDGSFLPPFAAPLDCRAINTLPVRILSVPDVQSTHQKNFRAIGRGFGFHKSAKFGQVESDFRILTPMARRDRFAIQRAVLHIYGKRGQWDLGQDRPSPLNVKLRVWDYGCLVGVGGPLGLSLVSGIKARLPEERL